MTRDRDRFFPGPYIGLDAFYRNRCTENSAVEDRPDRCIGTFPHLGEVVFFDTSCVRRDGCALDSNTVFLCRFSGIDRYLVACLFAVFKAEIIILGFKVDKRCEKAVLDLLPHNTGHFIAVHLYKRGCHSDLVRHTGLL